MSTKSGLSKELEPKPLREGQTAVFRLVNAGKIDPATGKEAFNSGALLEGETKIFDKGHNEIIILKNKIGEEIVKQDGRSTVVDKVGSIEFDSAGICRVKHNEPHKYRFLMRDNRCATNKFRDPSVPAMWEQIMEENLKQKEKIAADLSYEAEKIVVEADHNTVIAIGESLAKAGINTINLKAHITDVRHELRKYAKSNPKELIRASQDTKARIKVDILDADSANIIQFIQETNEWEWAEKHGKEKIITEVKPGCDPVEELTLFIMAQEEENKGATGDKKIRTALTEIKSNLREFAI